MKPIGFVAESDVFKGAIKLLPTKEVGGVEKGVLGKRGKEKTNRTRTNPRRLLKGHDQGEKNTGKASSGGKKRTVVSFVICAL